MEREHFGSRMAVVMAMAGSAIGLGNIWRFPYIVGEYGGAAFILVYILAGIVLSLPIFFSEAIIGRSSRSNPFGAMAALAPDSGWKWLGLITVISPLMVLSYYSVVGGWSVEYLIKSVALQFTNSAPEEIPSFFDTFIDTKWQPLVMHLVFLAMVAGIVLGGVKKGIEKFSKITMPILFVLILLIVVFSVMLPGSGEGVKYLVKPDFSKLTGRGVIAAVGQSFYSLSLGVGAVLTYYSYVKRSEDIVVSGVTTAVFDLVFALLAGFAVMPAVFACGIEPDAGPGLVFKTLPFIFNKMGAESAWVSAFVSIVFFLAILVAALTSAISMMEVGVAYLSEEKNISRKAATAIIFGFCLVVGAVCSLSSGVFNFFDHLCSDFLMIFGGLLFALFVGWKLSPSIARAELTNDGSLRFNSFCFKGIWFLIRYVAPIGVIAIFVASFF